VANTNRLPSAAQQYSHGAVILRRSTGIERERERERKKERERKRQSGQEGGKKEEKTTNIALYVRNAW
jgi:hypothetical protein